MPETIDYLRFAVYSKNERLPVAVFKYDDQADSFIDRVAKMGAVFEKRLEKWKIKVDTDTDSV